MKELDLETLAFLEALDELLLEVAKIATANPTSSLAKKLAKLNQISAFVETDETYSKNKPN